MPTKDPSNPPRPGIITGQPVTREKLARARELRQQMTPAERRLWQELRGNRLGQRFRRQQVIAGFIADFYCHAAGLVIELEGGVHRGREQEEYDRQRDRAFSELRLRVLRFWNGQVERDLPLVLRKIREALSLPSP